MFESLPEGVLVVLSKGCAEDGSAAIHCEGDFYTTTFPDIEALKNRLQDENSPTCKVNNGLQVIVDARRLSSF